jgi:hypothetical protein
MNYLYAVLVLLAIALGCEQWGEHRIQVKWDQDKAVREAQLETEKKHNQETVDDLNDKWKKTLDTAIGKAGRAAIDRFLREHGLLPSGLPVQPNPGAVQAQGPQVSDGAADQPGAGSGLAEFATGCALDALKVMDWQELCVRQHCEVE